jgi:hypothetical protein
VSVNVDGREGGRNNWEPDIKDKKMAEDGSAERQSIEIECDHFGSADLQRLHNWSSNASNRSCTLAGPHPPCKSSKTANAFVEVGF